ncbi:hypothetical protein JTB14_031651 [Gonioctena quinquepunctata]|nr:hypothetical protein JTB14_031651 [Gonioctena quinquepunctata]
MPAFSTSSQVFKVTDKDTVVLPCEVSNLGPYVLVWKKGIAVLSAGNVKVSPDPRVNLVHGYSLEIREAGPQDAGDYVCQIGTLEPREITHTVEILVPPRIHYVTSNGRVEVKKGSSMKLECKASGNPPPKITWSRKNNLLPDGVQTAVTPVLSLEKVDRHQAGVYQCTASNGVGEDISEQIVLHVLSFDNSDRCVDTLNGKETLHDTVGIIYQNIDNDDPNETDIDSRSDQSDMLPPPAKKK